MPKRGTLALAVAAIALAQGGCGTCANNVWFTPEEGGKRVYGGVQADCQVVREAFDEHGTSAPFWRTLTFSALDLPLSAVGDTVSLPYTLWWAWANEPGQRPEPLPAAPRQPLMSSGPDDSRRYTVGTSPTKSAGRSSPPAGVSTRRYPVEPAESRPPDGGRSGGTSAAP